jgi:hypothetical protein
MLLADEPHQREEDKINGHTAKDQLQNAKRRYPHEISPFDWLSKG